MKRYREKTHFEDKLNEVISELHIPQCVHNGSLYGSNNQRSAVIACKGDFPFPFQGLNLFLFWIEGEESRCRRLSFIVTLDEEERAFVEEYRNLDSKDKHQLKGYMDRLQDEKVENEHNN